MQVQGMSEPIQSLLNATVAGVRNETVSETEAICTFLALIADKLNAQNLQMMSRDS